MTDDPKSEAVMAMVNAMTETREAIEAAMKAAADAGLWDSQQLFADMLSDLAGEARRVRERMMAEARRKAVAS